MKVSFGKVGRILGALVTTALYGVYGVGLFYLLFTRMAASRNFMWLEFFRPGFYLPAAIIVAYLYIFKKKRGLFLDSLAFLLALSLAMFWTLELIVFL